MPNHDPILATAAQVADNLAVGMGLSGPATSNSCLGVITKASGGAITVAN